MFTQPQALYRDNLDPALKYVTAFSSEGPTNQIFSALKLVLAGQILRRVTILPLFSPNNLHGLWWGARFGDFFDLKHWSECLEIPVVEWHDVKLSADAHRVENRTENLFCWAQPGQSGRWDEPSLLKDYGILTTFIPTDKSTGWDWRGILHHGLVAPSPQALNATKGEIAKQNVVCLGRDLYRTESIINLGQNPGLILPEDPVWSHVGQHMHFTSRMIDLATQTLTRLGISSGDRFIGVHIRRGDFLGTQYITDTINPYIQEVEATQNMLRRPGSSEKPLQVVVTTDGTQPAFFKLLEEQGWIYVNHTMLGTLEAHGIWMPG
ncbi:hypothetical protein P7C70_g9422, partial [Phenoliferia sp. Uapishka_3]